MCVLVMEMLEYLQKGFGPLARIASSQYMGFLEASSIQGCILQLCYVVVIGGLGFRFTGQ